MGGKAKWRKLKRVVGPMPQGTQAPAKQHFKKERTKTRDAKRRRMGDGGEEDEDEADATADGSKKDARQSKDALSKSPSKKGQEPLKSPRGQASNKPTTQTNDETICTEDSNDPVSTQLSQAEGTEVIQEANGVEDAAITQTPQLMVTDLDSPIMEGLQKPNSEENLKEELRKATEEEYLQTEDAATEDAPSNATKDLETGITELTPQEIQEELQSAQKSTQTEAVNINNGDKPVKFFISDDSDSDTAIFVDAHPSAPNGDTGQMQTVDTEPVKDGEGIEISAVIDVKGETAVEVTFEGQDVEFGIEDACEQQSEAIETIGSSIEIPSSENQGISQLVDMEPSDSPRSCTVQRAKYLPSLAQPVKTETQKMFGGLRKPHGPTKFPFDHLLEGDNVSKSSTSDSVDNVSIERSSVSDLADPELSKASTTESAEPETQGKVSTADSVDLDTPSVTSVNELVEQEAESKVSLQELAEQETITISTTEVEQETMTLSTAESIEADIASKMSTIESAEPGTISKSSTRGSIDQDIISKSSASESGEPEFLSKTSASESGEPEFQSKTSYSEYEEAEGRTRTSVSEYGEADSISRTSVSESAEHDGTSRSSVSDSAGGTSQASMTATGTSVSATGEFRSSKSSVSCSSEFDAESLTSTADLLTPKEEMPFVSDAKAVPGLGEQAKLERDSPAEETADQPGSPGWEELNLEDHMQITGEGGSTEDVLQIKKEGSEADAESLFFSLYPEYQPGEVDDTQAEITDSTGGNPKILCFRGQTTEQGEGQEEIYMAAEKGDDQGIKNSRNKGTVSGKIHQFQRKLSQQKKSEREDKEITESEGSTTQQGGNGGSDEQQDSAEQILQGSPTDGGPQPSSDPTGGNQLSDVPDGTTPSSVTQATDAKEAEYSLSQAKDNLVCLSGQLGERVESIIETIEVVTEVTKGPLQAEKKPAELEEFNGKTELGHEALESESKLEANAKDRKTLVGKAKDWIKGVTRMGSKKEELSDKPTEKAETKKAETETKPGLQRKTSADIIAASVAATSMKDEEKDTLFDGKEKETSFIMDKEQVTEEEKEIEQFDIQGESDTDKVAAETDEIRNRKNASILESADIMDIKRTEENLAAADLEEDQNAQATDTGSQENGESLTEKQETDKEKEEAELNQELKTQVSMEKEAEIADQPIPEEELFDIVSPEEELSDSVFKDETADENGKAKESDDTEVQQLSPEEVLDAEIEKISSAEIKIEKEPGDLIIPKQEEQVDAPAGDSESTTPILNGNSHVVCDNASRELEADNQDDLATVSTENEASYVSVQESIEQDASATAGKLDTESTPKESSEKRRKTTKDESKPRRKRHEKSKSPSMYKENGKEESPKASRKDKEGKSGSKKRRHRRRTKSQEDGTEIQTALLEADGVQSSTEPRPEDVALPPDDFEAEKKLPPSSGATDGTTVSEKVPESLEEKKEAESVEPQISDKKMPAQEDTQGEMLEEKPAVQTSQTTPDQECTVEKRKSSSRSTKERRHSRKSEGEHPTSERKHHSKSRREKSLDSKQEKHDTEKLEKETIKSILKHGSSPREKLDKEEGSSFPATAATWSPRVDRKDRKSIKKSSDRKREEHSRDRPKISKETGDVTEQSVTSSKTPPETQDDEPYKKSHKTSKESKAKLPEPIILPAEPRDDTPIPSPKSEPHGKRFDFELSQKSLASSKDTASTGSQPLLQVFTFPEGVSKPVSPAPVIKELKFPPGVSKPVSPLPEKAKAPTFPSKPIPAPLTLHPDPDLNKPAGKPVSPLNTLTFPEGVSKPISPMPQKAPQLIPKPEVTSASSLDDDKPLLYPAKPVSPLRMLHFPEGIPKPKSPLPPNLQEKQEPSVKSISSIPEVQSVPSSDQHDKEESPAAPTTDKVHKPLSPPLKKPRPRLMIPKVDNDSLQTTEASLEPAKPVSPLKTLQFPEGISKPVSPIIKKAQQALFKLDSHPEKTEKLPPETENLTADSSISQLSMKEPARPVSPLKIITFPAGISKPVSPLPPKATQQLFKPIPSSRPIPPPLDSLKANEEVSQNDVSELEKKESTTVSQSSSVTTTVTRTEVLTTLTFPEGVSKPISPLPQKTKFSGELFKPVQETTKPTSSSGELFKTVHATDKPSPAAREVIRPSIPSDFFMTVHEAEKPTSAAELIKSLQAAAKPSLPSQDLLGTIEKTSAKLTSPEQSTQLTTFKFPEGVSKPISPLPVKGKPLFSTVGPSSPAQKTEVDRSPTVTSSNAGITTKTESPSIFSFTLTKKKDEKAEEPPKPTSPVVPLTQKEISGTDNKELSTTKPSTVISQILRHSTPDTTTSISPAPLKIKHFVDYPSETFPCTKPRSPASKTAPPSLIKPTSPGFKISSPTVSSPTTARKPSSPLPKTASPVTKVFPSITKPQSPAPDTKTFQETQEPPVKPSEKPDTEKEFSPDRLDKTQPESIKRSPVSRFPEYSFKIQLDSDKSITKSFSPDLSPRTKAESTRSTISQTHLTYSEASKRFTPSPRPLDELSKEITPTPPLTPPPEPEKEQKQQQLPSSPCKPSRGKHEKFSPAVIQTIEARSGAKYSRGEEPKPSSKSKGQRDASQPLEGPLFPAKDEGKSKPAADAAVEPPATSKTHSFPGIRCCSDRQQTPRETLRPSPDITRSRHEGSHSPKEGSRSPHAGSDSPSKKLRRRKRR